MKRYRHRDDDDEIIRDGQAVRVPLTMMDAVQRAVARGAAHLTDHVGNGVGTGALNRPGFRCFLEDEAGELRKERAYRDHERYIRDAYKTPVDEPDTIVAREDHRSIGQRMRDHQQRMSALYEAADAEAREAWRRGK
jgi:hypothetical protein